MTTRALIVFMSAVALLPAQQFPRAKTSAEQMTFGLFNHCQPVELVVNAIDLWRSAEAVVALVHKRANESRYFRLLPSDDGILSDDHERLFVELEKGAVYWVRLEFRKLLIDPASGFKHWAKTWHEGAVESAREVPLSTALDQVVNKFIGSYERVNESACRSRP